MSDGTTTTLNLVKPEIGASKDTWGEKINDNWDKIDAAVAGKAPVTHTHTMGQVTGLDAALAQKAEVVHTHVITDVTDLAAQLAAVLPAGSVFPYAGAAAPAGWFLCGGQAVSRTTYAALFAAIGTIYGGGDGSTTFNLPDLRGRVVVGRDDMAGADANRVTTAGSGIEGNNLGAAGGAESVALTEAQLAPHTHFVVSDSAGSGTLASSNYLRRTYDGTTNLDYSLKGGTPAATLGLTSATGSGAAHINMQPSFVLNYIIKA